MGNTQCPTQDGALLASVARDICPFPNYHFNLYLPDFLSSNASMYLSTKYAAVQASLTPQQQQAFTRSLRSTFGREGKVSYGGVGVVALSLAVLFDTVARQVKGQYVSDQEPIPGLFLRDPTGYYAPSVYTISRYLRLVPHIANNPTRMREETKRYLKQLIFDEHIFKTLLMETKQDDFTVLNRHIGEFMQWPLYLHLHHLANASFADTVAFSAEKEIEKLSKTYENTLTYTNFYNNVNFNLNCDPEEGSKQFFNQMKQSGQRTGDAFKKCNIQNMEDPKTWLHHIARVVWLDVVMAPVSLTGNKRHHIAQKDDFDLKVGALGNWATS